MQIRDLHQLPRVRDSAGHLYLEHCKIDQGQKAIEYHNKEGRTRIPVANLSVLMLGPGTSISHEAIKALTDNGCLAVWVGERGVRFYAQGLGETRKSWRLIRQAELVSDPIKHKQVVLRMYKFRFDEQLSPDLNMQQIRGMEGARVRRVYATLSKEYGVPWSGRFYTREAWGASDTINRTISAANACLNSLCHSAIVAAGYSPGLGFIHIGKQLSFVYDIADLYKMDLTVPLAFKTVAENKQNVETRVRKACRDLFHQQRLLANILTDIDQILAYVPPKDERETATDSDLDPASPGALWSADEPEGVAGGVNYDEVNEEQANREKRNEETKSEEQSEQGGIAT